jgi:putative ABC transport system substrate-binding protein
MMACGYPAAIAAAQHAGDIPVIVTEAGDPVEAKLVDSLAHPGGRVTGLSEIAATLSAKRLQLLKEAVPTIRTVVAHLERE